MARHAHVLLTETAIVVVEKGVPVTSIPMRVWERSDHDNPTNAWSSRSRQPDELDALVRRLKTTLERPTDEPIMRRVMSVMS